jgi:tetraacyldisaccharide 4'-kinase
MVVLDRRPKATRLLDALDAAAPGGFGAWLAPLGALYARAARLRRRLAPARPLPCAPPSIGIGNLRVGGCGKTPLVAALGRQLQARGLRVAVLTRGYGAQRGGDEPHWLQGELGAPVLRDGDRSRGFAQAAAGGAQVVLLDDALQCGVVATVLLVVVLDRDLRIPPRPLPAGPAREGADALRRAQMVLIRVEEDPWPPTAVQHDAYARWAAQACGGRAFPFRLAPASLVSPAGVELALARGRELGAVVLASGLARPRSFERDARRAGLDPVASLRLADHALPTARDARALTLLADALGAGAIVCPEKNHARLAALALARPLYRLRARIEWAGEDPAERVAQAAGL